MRPGIDLVVLARAHFRHVKGGACAAAVVLAALALPASAFAHATLLRTSPANDAVLSKSPAQVKVVFDDVVIVGPGIQAIRNSGGSITSGRPFVTGHGRTLVIPLKRGLGDGAYTARWSIISDDGHLESGVVAWAVGKGEHAEAALTASGSGPQTPDVVSRWILYAGLLTAVGVALFALVVRPGDDERIALLVSTACVLVAIGAGEEAHRIGLETRAGKAFAVELAAGVVVAMVAGAATLDRRVLRPALVLALGLVVPPAFAGHADDLGVNRINVPADALHILGAAAWAGVLVGVLVFRTVSYRRAFALALAGVVLLAVTGVVRAWSELVSFSQLWHTSYGQTLLVKTGLLLLALGLGWLLRARTRRRAALELVFVACLLVAVSVLVLLRPGRDVVPAAAPSVSASEPAPAPPLPPRGALVLAQEMGQLGVALHLLPRSTTAIVISPAGGGLSGLDVHLNGKSTRPCGHGCYRLDQAPGSSVDVRIDRFGPPLESTFSIPATTSPGAALFRRVDLAYRTRTSVFYLEHLASSPTQVVNSLWRLEAPDRLAYQIPGGAQGIVIGSRRWDRDTPDGPWHESAQTPLPQPATLWSEVSNATIVDSNSSTKTLTFMDPSTPAYFTMVVDAKTFLPREVHMTAASHFMVDRYVRFNAPRAIYPPR